MKRLCLVLLTMAFAAGAFAQKPCSANDAATAEKVVDRVVNWDQLYKAFQDYRHCDQGPVADVYTDALMRCLVEWKQVDALAGTMQKDKDYHDFIFRHLRAASGEDQKSVFARAKMSCPKGLEPWCGELIDASKPLTFQGIEMAPMPSFNAPPPAAAPPKK